MQLTTKYHYDMMAYFEKTFTHLRLDREPKDIWVKGRIYQSDEANKLFLAFRHGVAYGVTS